VFATQDAKALSERLARAEIAFARVNDTAALARHPHLRRINLQTPSGPVAVPAPAAQWATQSRSYGPVPALGEHTEKVRREFLGGTESAPQGRINHPLP
jgi:itaconate CoA-transferase